jgi:hypothetical protein
VLRDCELSSRSRHRGSPHLRCFARPQGRKARALAAPWRLFALSRLSFRVGSDSIADHYHEFLDFVGTACRSQRDPRRHRLKVARMGAVIPAASALILRSYPLLSCVGIGAPEMRTARGAAVQRASSADESEQFRARSHSTDHAPHRAKAFLWHGKPASRGQPSPQSQAATPLDL